MGYAPNALGQPTQAGSYASGVQYFPNGAMKAFTYGNGMVHGVLQNVRGLPEWWADCTVAVGCDLYERVVHLRYDYDANGNVSAMTDNSLSGRQTRAMSYDGRDRLLTVASPMYPGGATYAYDVLDNLTRVSVAGRDHRYQYDASNRLTQATDGPGGPVALTLAYDVRGNLSNRNGQAFGFDQGNRLRSALGTESYRYDAHGRRTRTSTPGGLLYEMYSQDGKLLWQRDEVIGYRFQYVHLNGRVVAVRKRPTGADTEEVSYWHTDALGSQIAASVGMSVVQTTEHEPYGKQLNRPNNNRMGYTGHVMDANTGLTQMQQRYMDPMLGRMLSRDPVTAYGTGNMRLFNGYAYANNNPYRFTDPDGRIPVETIWDVTNVVMGAQSAYSNFSHGNIGAGIVDSLGVVVDAAATVVPYVPGGAGTAIKAARGVDNAVDAARSSNAVPKPPTGRGSVPPSERDPKRTFPQSEKAEGLSNQGGNCANCGKPTDLANSDAHHVQRHADGGATKPENMAVVCKDCHKELHRADK